MDPIAVTCENRPGVPQALTVTQLARVIRDTIRANPILTRILVRGEVSNLQRAPSGHVFFTLKDATAQLSCTLFREDAEMLGFDLEDGMDVVVSGDVDVFPRRGSVQLLIKAATPAGVGAFWAAYQKTRKKLAAEGLFDAARKRPLPGFPQRIGVVTSEIGAVVHDIVTILRRRYPIAHLVIAPALVQGPEAPASLRRALAVVADRVDVVIVARGGGSLEDLWCFNDEGLARAVAASRVPVVSAIGHETDVTIVDFVADVRAATPSAAAELVSPDVTELMARGNGRRRRGGSGRAIPLRPASKTAGSGFTSPKNRRTHDRRAELRGSPRGPRSDRGRFVPRRPAARPRPRRLRGRTRLVPPLPRDPRGLRAARDEADRRGRRTHRRTVPRRMNVREASEAPNDASSICDVRESLGWVKAKFMLDSTCCRSVKDKSALTIEQVYGANTREEILRLRNIVRQEFGSLYDRLLRILSTSDPMGLLSHPGISPEDWRVEYAPEVETILLRRQEASSQKALRRIVHQEFQRWFHPKIAGPESRYEKVATGIWNAFQSHRNGNQNLPRPATRPRPAIRQKSPRRRQ